MVNMRELLSTVGENILFCKTLKCEVERVLRFKKREMAFDKEIRLDWKFASSMFE